MEPVADLVIVGGGLGGLSLAAELSRPEFSDLRILLLEQRQGYQRDRTWSYWRGAPHAYAALERMHWARWRVSEGARSHTHAGASDYRTLDSDAFYREALGTIAACRHVELRLDTQVTQVESGDRAHIHTAGGGRISSRWAFDARPPLPPAGDPLVQQFVGWEVETAFDAFDHSTVDLMAFRHSDQGLHFFYVLPYSARRALVETTWISHLSHQPDHASDLKGFLRERLGPASYTVVYEEAGVLGLEPAASRDQPRIVRLGRNAGTLRQSSGYAFLETLAHSAQIAQSLRPYAYPDLVASWRPCRFSRPAADRWMDRIFLQVLKSDWNAGTACFMDLFGRVDADTLTAFLGAHASWRQRFSVIRAMPVLPFAKAALAALLSRA